MALLACAKCGGKVSDRATTCPHCGRPVTLQGSGAKPVPPDSGLAGQAEQNLGRLMRSPKGLYVAVACVLVVILAVAVGRTPSRSSQPITQTSGRQNPPPSLPPEFRTLAMHLAREVKHDPQEFHDDKGFTECIAEGNAAVMGLGNIKSSDTDINYIASEGQAAYAEVVKRLETLDALPKPTGGKFLAESLVDLLNRNLSGPIARFSGVDPESQSLAGELEGLVAAANRVEAAGLLLPRVAQKYAPPIEVDSRAVGVRFRENWGDIVGPNDWLILQNTSGQVLEDCTIVVDLTGVAGDVKTNVHYVRSWAASSSVFVRYETGQEVNGRTVDRTTVRLVQTVKVTVYSPKLSAAVNYTYQGEEKTKDFAERCAKLTLSGQYRPFAHHFLLDDQRAAIVTLDGVDVLPPCTVTVAFVRGSESKSWLWNIDGWKRNEKKTFATSKGELPWDPDRIDLSIGFPNSTYEFKERFSIK